MHSESMSLAPTPTASEGGLKRKRARAACTTCHQRKVRCDVSSLGAPCTNCRLDTLNNCCIRASGRERTRMKRKMVFSFVPHSMNLETELRNAAEIPSPIALPSSLLGNLNDRVLSPNKRLIRLRASSPPRLPSTPSRDFRWSEVFQTSGDDASSSNYTLTTLKNAQMHSMDYLKSKGCFQLPARPHLDELVRHYFRNVHPHLPVLEEEEFGLLYTSIECENDLRSQYSIIVLQAMLFAASAFVSLSALNVMGFRSYHDARKTFYERAKLLYDFQIATDSTAISRAALLLSFHSASSTPQNNSTWLSVGIQHARAENCHLYYCTPNITARKKSQKKRLWWCCVIRDRVIALGMRRHVQITTDHFDFDQETIMEEDFALEIENSKVYSADVKRLLVREFVVQCQLAVAVTPSLLTIYPLNGQLFPIVSTESDFFKKKAQIKECTKELAKWEYKAKLQSTSDDNDLLRSCEAVIVYRELTYLYYSSARIALCNHTIRILNEYYNFSTDSMAEMHANRVELEEGIISICRTVTSLTTLGFVGFLPLSVIAWVALPLALLFLDSKLSPNTLQHTSGQHGYHSYSEFLRLFGLRFEFVDTVTNIISNTVDLVESTLSPVDFSLVDDPSNMSWSDILARHPRLYLRMLFLLDSSLSRDQQPSLQFPRVDEVSEIRPSSSLKFVATNSSSPGPKLQPSTPEETWLHERLKEISLKQFQKTSMTWPESQLHTVDDISPFLLHDVLGFSGDGLELLFKEETVDLEERVVVEQDAHQILDDMISFMFDPSPAACGL